MRRKILQHFANVVCEMCTSARLSIADLETLSVAPDGEFQFDLLHGRALTGGDSKLDFEIVDDLKRWLAQQLAENHIPLDALHSAAIDLTKRTDRIPTDHQRIIVFDFDCRSRIATSEVTYEGNFKAQRTYKRGEGFVM